VTPRAEAPRIRRYASAASFLTAAEPFLLEAEAENNLILGIAHALAAGSTPATRPYLATAHDRHGVCMAAFQSVPAKLGTTRGRTPEAIPFLARDVHEACSSLLDVLGPEPTIETFAAELALLRGTTAEPSRRQRIYELREVAPLPRQPTGRMRPATRGDAELLVGWVSGFLEDIQERGDAAAQVAERVGAEQVYLWDDDGPRAMAAWGGKTPNGVRVNLVYTPPDLRGRGYATALVAGLSRRLLDQGNQHCMLYTDLANPTSNAIYRRIGYLPVTDAAVYRLAG
jgi:GNAT superfamily N-acetyltransferase